MLNDRTMILLLRQIAIIFYCVWQFNQALSGFVVGHHGNISYEVKQFYLQSFSYCFIICIFGYCALQVVISFYTVNLKRSLIILEHHTGQD